ncbi:MAG: uroporphyrinogen decarboxylase [Verrucomicrobia bacterium]|nr:MAG: uroporphyrinogen decarboxylase [Verrucomicrobiota bacterium]
MTSRERFLAACNQQNPSRPPIWIMRQAGRYLPEYRSLKEKYSFLELVKTPDLAAEVTLQPLKRFPLDASIIFSDILIIPEALGQSYHFKEEGGIAMDFSLDSPTKINSLDNSNIQEKLSYLGDALKLVRSSLGSDKALLGFGGAPWTLATYMVEGGSSKDFTKIKSLAYQSPALFHNLMEKITFSLIDLFKLQIDSGADAIQIFDSWGSLCPGIDYWDLSLKWIKTIIDALPKDFPIILFTKGMSHHAENLLKTGAKILSLDWTVNMHQFLKTLPTPTSLQGNLDPVILNTTPEIVRTNALKLLDQMQSHPGFIFNLGHGILPEAKIENVQTLIQTVIDYIPSHANHA